MGRSQYLVDKKIFRVLKYETRRRERIFLNIFKKGKTYDGEKEIFGVLFFCAYDLTGIFLG